MLERIVVPVDGSPLAARILRLARPLLRRATASVLLVRVVGERDPDGHAGPELEARRAELAAEGVRAETRVLTGDPAARITEVASDWGADLIAMTTHGRTGLARLVRGSVAENVLRRATLPLLLANPFARDGELALRRLVVGVDDSREAESVLSLAAALAQEFGAELVLAHVVAVEPLDSPVAVADARTRAFRSIEEARRRVAALPSVRTRVVHGPTIGTILEVAREEGADLLCLATHGRQGVQRLAYGSVAEQLMRQAEVPVLVTRAA